jgi:predicted nuclease of restriction endonuclease-like RecB superfamily
VEFGGNNLELARQLIRLYTEAIGKKKRELNEQVSELEEWGNDYRFVRGLATLLDRKCRMETKASVNPIDVRRRLFQASSETGIPTTKEERRAIIAPVAEELGLDIEAVEEAFYADLDDEMVLVSFDSPDPVNLLREYNLGITQTLLFNASEMSFTASGNWQHIFRQIKWLGLIYTVTRENMDYYVKIDGPTSLFKLNRRYGTSMAKLLPRITRNSSWRIQAKIVSPTGKYLLNLELNSSQHGNYIEEATGEGEKVFDSGVEEDFAIRFDTLRTDWRLVREPGPLPVGNHVMLPDFLFEHGGLRVYLEIVGFWTPDYLADKLRKLDAARGVDLLVAVDRRLACKIPSKRLEHLRVVYYKDKVPLKPILTHLQERVKTVTDREAKGIVGTELKLSSPVVEICEVACLLGVSTDSVRAVIESFSFSGYRRLGDIFIQKSLLDALDTALRTRLTSGKLNFGEASKLIESLGGKNPSSILEALGYRIITETMDVFKWYIVPKEKSNKENH